MSGLVAGPVVGSAGSFVCTTSITNDVMTISGITKAVRNSTTVNL